ncbi:MAG: hypothetical protein ACJ0PE_00025 [Flavobacteriaceae bacterium]|tara:strand:+ start:4759 stop:6084 length:1326 start_codon:yes stop_codon:yes gene_type:complete
MRFVILLLLSSFLSAQEFEGDDFLIIEGESSQYYYVLKREGYYLSDKPKKLNLYTKSIPESLNVDFSTLKAVTHNSKTYILYPGGGLLYSFINGTIERVDRSFPHRNQYGGYFFSYNNNLYLIGGYGFWQTKSIITKFNFNNGDWEIINATGQLPKGLDQGTYFFQDDNLYVFDFLSRRTSNQKEKREDNLYVLNLKNFNWKKVGVINDIIKADNQKKGSKRFFKIDDKLLVSYTESPEFYLVDLKTNIIQKFKDDALFYKSGRAIVKRDKLVGTIKNPVTGLIKVESFDLKNMLSNKLGKELYLYRSSKEFFIYISLSFTFLFFLILVLNVYYKRVGQTYILNKDSLSGLGNSINLIKNEYDILKLFSEKRSVSNSLIMDMFIDENKTKDFAVKKKNKAILALEKKLSLIFKKSFIKKEKSKSDSRQLNYFLNKRIKIIE